jgi:hypothetical protein
MPNKVGIAKLDPISYGKLDTTILQAVRHRLIPPRSEVRHFCGFPTADCCTRKALRHRR